MQIIINAIIQNNRDKLILQEHLGGESLAHYIATIFEEHFPGDKVTAVTNNSFVTELMKKNGVSTLKTTSTLIESEWIWIGIIDIILTNVHRKMIDQENTVLMISPALGIITPERVLQIYKKYLEDPSTIVISSRKLENNCSPGWLNVTEKNATSVTSYENEQLKPFLPAEYFRPDVRHMFPEHDTIKGSQWLPDFFIADEALVCFHGSMVNDQKYSNQKLWEFNQWENGSVHPIRSYNLPLFQISADTFSCI